MSNSPRLNASSPVGGPRTVKLGNDGSTGSSNQASKSLAPSTPKSIHSRSSVSPMSISTLSPVSLKTQSPVNMAIDTLEAKILQFIYAIVKLKALLAACKKLINSTNASNSNQLALIHYIILLAGNLFAINEQAFSNKLKFLSNFKLFKPLPITISSISTHVPYDNSDSAIIPLESLPLASTSNKCLKLFDYLCVNCIHGYQKRLQQAKQEKNNASYLDDLEDILEKLVFLPELKDVDLSIATRTTNDVTTSPFLYPIPDPHSDQLNDNNFVEATLIDMDIKTLFTITKHLHDVVDHAKKELNRFRPLKNLSKSQQDNYINSLSQGQYSLHKILMWTYRLNDVYSVLRKFGRKVYLSNYQHLYDQKFAFNSKNGIYFKNQQLKEVDDLFNSTKKNGILIANLTRFIRANSRHENNARTILDFSNFLNQSLNMIESSIKKFEEFGHSWIQTEMHFRKMYELPSEELVRIYTQNQKKPIVPNSIVQSPKSAVNKLKRSENESATKSSNQSLSRSSSVSSGNSSLSIGTKEKLSQPFVRKNSVSSNSSISSPQRHSMIGFPTPTLRANPNTSARPMSTISLASNDSFHDAKSESHPPNPNAESEASSLPGKPNLGRRRSNSQPISSTEVMKSLETGAAATALKKSFANSNGLKLPTGSIKDKSDGLTRSSSLSKITNSSEGLSSPPLNKTKPLIVLKESEEEAVNEFKRPTSPKLTANQRLQLHIKQAAKSGSLMTQQKETFSHVVFDPNSPSSVNLKKYLANSPPPAELQPAVVVSPTASPPSEPAKVKPTTRAQITKINTQKNSILSDSVSEDNQVSRSSLTIASEPKASRSNSITPSSSPLSESAQITEAIKKVRFTGVPEYTPEEDAPTKYSARILKNFAVFKTPSSAYKPAFKRKDQMLKKEESLLFKKNLSEHESDAAAASTSAIATALGGSPSPNNSAVGAAAALADKTSMSFSKPLTQSRLSKFKNKFI